jgi:nicotinate-nucleotide pyrophosphorylase (carboxylating)
MTTQRRRKRAKGGNPAQRGFNEYTEKLVKASLVEDVGSGDITTGAIVPPKKKGTCRLVAGEDLVVCGLGVCKKVFASLDRGITFKVSVNDGDAVKKGAVLARVSGRLGKILSGERVALNFLQRLSGVATLTREFTKKAGANARILDTRKTTPCMRILEKYAVRVGGGYNHRFGLFDSILIKDNHIKIAGGVAQALAGVRKNYPQGAAIEVEVKNLKEVKEAVRGGADIIMLDNMDIKKIKSALELIGGKATVEVSGGITLKNLTQVVRTGVDFISTGSLTHSARAVDISMEVETYAGHRRRG